MLGWLDRIPPPARDLLVMLGATGLAWAGSDLVPVLHQDGGAAAVVGSILGSLILYVTPLERQYGAIWAHKPPALPEAHPGSTTPTS